MAEQKDRVGTGIFGRAWTRRCASSGCRTKKDLDVIARRGRRGAGARGPGDRSSRRRCAPARSNASWRTCARSSPNDYLTCAIAANALYENKYPLLSALSRPLISKHLVDIAHEYGAKYVAHGCTGKGNDQVRFEASISCARPGASTIIAPVREWDLKSRPQEMAWAREHGVEVPTTNARPYSIDDNLWGRAIECGVLENPWNEPPDDIYTMTADPLTAPDEPEFAEISFKQRRSLRRQRRRHVVSGCRPGHERDRRAQRLRAPGHDREPAGGRQEPRMLRGAGRPGHHRGAQGA